MQEYTKYRPVADSIKNIDLAINRILKYCKDNNFYAILEDNYYFELFIYDLKRELEDEEIIKDYYLKDLPHNAVKSVKNIELKSYSFNYHSCKITFDLEMNNKDFNNLAYCYLVQNKKTDTRAFKILKKCLRNGYDLQGQELLGTCWINVEVDNVYYELKDPDSEEITNLYFELADKIRSSIEDRISNDIRSHNNYYYSIDRFIDYAIETEDLDIILKSLQSEDFKEYLEMIKELGI